MDLAIDSGLAVITMNGPKANAMNPEFLVNISKLFDEFEASDARAAVLTGHGRFFSAGLDLPTLFALKRPELREFINSFSQAVCKIFSLTRPLVAAVNGHAIAGGCVLAQQADWRLMSRGSGKIGLREVALGVGLPLVVVETLRDRVPGAKVLNIALLGELFDADGALDCSLVDEACAAEDLLEQAKKRADALGSQPRAAYAHIKTSLRRPAMQRIQAGLEEDTEAWLDTWFSEDAQRLVKATIDSLKKKS